MMGNAKSHLSGSVCVVRGMDRWREAQTQHREIHWKLQATSMRVKKKRPEQSFLF